MKTLSGAVSVLLSSAPGSSLEYLPMDSLPARLMINSELGLLHLALSSQT
jgi:hypothetical protein